MLWSAWALLLDVVIRGLEVRPSPEMWLQHGQGGALVIGGGGFRSRMATGLPVVIRKVELAQLN